ncbi:hypothetical protein C7H84_15895 [Burkholderia sp. Nafp2/4-1b]|uniref:hypothetical protein n=1 Tax=Burkholderia sp. Nafp2/4-1b TaxID=2116686 RepID=UPI000EF9613D|nr:hypothetical protein [Burkholderia sp. Nafp2/4-1b]RKU02488.1 hypothetical protein C7H84_15895 [Burkholderia sp. Nafp2/4-1b]
MRNRQADAAGLLAFFTDRLDLKTLSDDELEFLSFASESAVNDALSLQEQVSGIAGLIAQDRGQKDPGSGCLQGDNQAGLLWKIAGDVEVIARMMAISADADCERLTRATSQPESEQFRRISSAEHS